MVLVQFWNFLFLTEFWNFAQIYVHFWDFDVWKSVWIDGNGNQKQSQKYKNVPKTVFVVILWWKCQKPIKFRLGLGATMPCWSS
jgi:hypothetical protein